MNCPICAKTMIEMLGKCRNCPHCYLWFYGGNQQSYVIHQGEMMSKKVFQRWLELKAFW